MVVNLILLKLNKPKKMIMSMCRAIDITWIWAQPQQCTCHLVFTGVTCALCGHDTVGYLPHILETDLPWKAHHKHTPFIPLTCAGPNLIKPVKQKSVLKIMVIISKQSSYQSQEDVNHIVLMLLKRWIGGHNSTDCHYKIIILNYHAK